MNSGQEVVVPAKLSTLQTDEKRRLVQRLFSRIAVRYDWFNRLASCGLDQRWRTQAVARGEITTEQRVLDVCAGTGDLALLCARRQRLLGAPGPRGRGEVIGVDFNREMLEQARRKQRARGLSTAWLQADAESLPFAGERFDRVVIGFSTRNLSHLSVALAEMARVLRPGGRLVILETGYPAHPLLRAGYQLFLFTVARTIGWLLTGRLWPFTYLARSVRQFLTPEEFTAQLRRVTARVEYVPLSWGLASLYLATKDAEGVG